MPQVFRSSSLRSELGVREARLLLFLGGKGEISGNPGRQELWTLTFTHDRSQELFTLHDALYLAAGCGT